MMDIVIFNVELGQCVFFYPRNNPEYAMMIDCGNTPSFEPIDLIIKWNLLRYDSSNRKYILPDLTLTNYDHDHFSGLPYLLEKVSINTVRFPRNLTGNEIINLKPEKTDALNAVVNILNTYNSDVQNYTPPYSKHSFYLRKEDFAETKVDTNKLSQLVFVYYNGTSICIPGDLTSPAWEKHITNKNVQLLLKKTDVFIASHHGRENGFNENVFNYCKPEVVILSDKDIIHKTQQGQTKTYGDVISGRYRFKW